MILKKALSGELILDFSKESPSSKFSCQSGCQECCGYAYFLPAEISKLPEKIRCKLIKSSDGMFDIRRNSGRCVFYDSTMIFFCSIYEYRPLRCQIYPYFPLIVDGKIIITMEPALKMKNSLDEVKHCPGIAIKGKSLKQSINECIVFLKYLNDVPKLLSTIVLSGEAFSKIRNDRWFIDQLNYL